jgi:Reverse transcriptase (RNA-dependent DNA polymerase)
LQEWKEYYSNLLKETRDKYEPEAREILVADNENEMHITLAEIKSTLRKMKNKKAAGPGNIPIELVKYAPDILLERLVFLYNKCLLQGENVPKEWNLAYISSIYKKGDKKQCKNYRGISVTSTLGRLYGKILKERIENELTEIEEQSGFRAGRSCTDNVFTLSQITERRTARNLNTHLIFVDLEKAYDTVPLNKLFEVLDESDLSRVYVRAIYNIYKDAKAVIKIGKNISEPFEITKGLKQGCCLSPTLFKIYIQKALYNWMRKCKNMGIEIGNDCLYTLIFADDQVIIATDEDDVQYMYRKLEEELIKWGLKINIDKTEYLNVGGEKRDLPVTQGTIKGCYKYKYLGNIISEKGNTDKDIQNRLTQGRRSIQMLNPLLWSPKITLKTKTRIYQTIVEPIMTYGSECWQMNNKDRTKLQAVEMDYLRRSCRISRMEHIRNDTIRQKIGMKDTVIERIETRQLVWYGHVMRMGEQRWPKKALEYVPRNRRKKGRPRTTWKQNVEKAMSSRDLEENECWDRKMWRVKCGKRPRL